MTCQIDIDCVIIWYNVEERLHRDGNLPAIEYPDRSKRWYNAKGEVHRNNDLPAIEYINGDKCWCVNGERHRLGGLPAMEGINENKCWFIYNKRFTYEQVINYYEILTRFGRYYLKKIRIRQLKRIKFIHVELLGMPIKSKYPGGQDSHKVISYFTNYVKN